MIVIVDYGMGNLRSVLNALEALGATAEIAADPSAIVTADRLILPGVGAFGEAMDRLRARQLIEPLGRAVGQGTPILGICLGMQLFAERGLEHGTHTGLGWIGGTVRRLTPNDSRLRVPHMGWNDLSHTRPSRILAGVGPAENFYFVHSYQLDPQDGGDLVATCDYGGPFAAVIEHGHIVGTQFHPEKSQKAGLLVLRNFLALS